MTIIIIRTLILYIVVTIAVRLMGKRQIGDMQPNELVVTLLISEIAAIPLQDTTQPVVNGIVAVFMLVIIEIVMSVLTMKFFKLRRLLSGKSIIIIKDGAIDQNAMRQVRLTVIDLIELLRAQNVFDISTVAFAVLEVNGNLSILLKNAEQPVTAKQMNIKTESDTLPMPIISDGKFINETLRIINTDKNKIKQILKKQGVSERDVFLMTMDNNGNYTISKKEQQK